MPEHVDLAKATFNKTWEYLDRAERTEDDDREMLAHAAASWYHWRQVGDAKNRSVSDWQMSRVFVVLRKPDLAMSFARACLRLAAESELDPVYVGFGHEAVARAAALGGNTALRDEHLAAAQAIVETLTDEEDREVLAADLATIE
jgi:cation transport regulator ChaB